MWEERREREMWGQARRHPAYTEVRGQLAVFSLLPSGIWGSNSSFQTCMTSTFTRWAILLTLMLCIKGKFIKLGSDCVKKYPVSPYNEEKSTIQATVLRTWFYFIQIGSWQTIAPGTYSALGLIVCGQSVMHAIFIFKCHKDKVSNASEATSRYQAWDAFCFALHRKSFQITLL